MFTNSLFLRKESYGKKPVFYVFPTQRFTLLIGALLKADMKNYIPLETAAIFFSSEPFSKTEY